MLHLTPEQIDVLKQLKAIELAKKADVRFTDPDDDEASKRRCIYLDGGYDMLNYLLTLDEEITKQKEAEKEQLLTDAPSAKQQEFNQSLNQPGF